MFLTQIEKRLKTLQSTVPSQGSPSQTGTSIENETSSGAAAPARASNAKLKKNNTRPKLSVVPDAQVEIEDEPSVNDVVSALVQTQLQPVELVTALVEMTEEPVTSLEVFFAKYLPVMKGKRPMGTKKVEGQVPDELHQRMVAFIAANKDTPGAPQSIKTLICMALGHTLEYLENLPKEAKSEVQVTDI